MSRAGLDGYVGEGGWVRMLRPDLGKCRAGTAVWAGDLGGLSGQN